MKVAVYNQEGVKVEDLTLSKSFETQVSPEAVTLYVNYLRSAMRSPIANTKDRSQVRGGGKKPWRQKGTGNARVGSSRSPLWVGGGVTFGPSNERNFKKRINKAEKKRIILGIISDFIKDKKAIFVSDMKMSEPKTKKASEILEALKAVGKIAVLLNKNDENSKISLRNIQGVKPMSPAYLDMIYLLSSDSVVISKDTVSEIENLYSKDKAHEGKKDE